MSTKRINSQNKEKAHKYQAAKLARRQLSGLTQTDELKTLYPITATPSMLARATMPVLQHAVGNQAISQLIQIPSRTNESPQITTQRHLVQRQPNEETPAPTIPTIHVIVGDERKKKSKSYARKVGKEDARRILQADKLDAEFRGELNAKLRWFEGDAHDIYTETIKPALEALLRRPPEIDMPVTFLGDERKKKLSKWEIDYLLWILDDVLLPHDRLIHESWGEYKVAFEKLYQALAGHRIGDSKKKISGRERSEMFDEAIFTLRPVLAHATEEQRRGLQIERARLLREEAYDRIEHIPGVEKTVIPGGEHQQAAMLHAGMPKLILTLHNANEQLERLEHHQHEEASKYLEEHGHGDAISKIGTFQSSLSIVDAWLTLSDEHFQHELSNIHGVFPGVKTYTELVIEIIKLTRGTVTLSATIGATIAKVIGKAEMASSAIKLASKVSSSLGDVLAGIEIVHGVFVLLDSESTREEKEKAVVDIASGSTWFVGRWLGGAAVGAAGSIALLLTYLEMKYFGKLYWEASFGLTTGLMSGTFKYIQDYGESMANQIDKFAGANILLMKEGNPIKVQVFKDIILGSEKGLAIAFDDFLEHCKEGGSKDTGWLQNIQEAPSNIPILVEVFKPLQPLRSAKSGPALAMAGTQIMDRIMWCLTHWNEIVEATHRRKSLHDIEIDATKNENGHHE